MRHLARTRFQPAGYAGQSEGGDHYLNGRAPVQLGGVEDVEIVGIARDSKYRGVREETPRIAYTSFAQDERHSGERTVYIRTAGDPLPLVAALRREVADARSRFAALG
jgi:hypothetical protein